MHWNWQQKDWPAFSWDARALEHLERQFIQNAGFLAGALRHVRPEEDLQLRVALMSEEACRTSEIEGEILDRDSVQSSICRHFGLAFDARRVAPVEQGIAQMMVDVYQTYEAPLSHEMLAKWHTYIVSGRRDMARVGAYRIDEFPMQIVSGPIHSPRIHFEAPPSKQVALEMDAFVSWFNEPSSPASSRLPALTKAGMAHLYFESIHPFEDGNGRVGRAIVEKSLSQSLGAPTLVGVSRTIALGKKAYYEALHQASRTNSITPWLLYFAQVVLDAQAYTHRLIEYVIYKAKIYAEFADSLNERQKKVLNRLFEAGPSGFVGGLSAKKYIQLTGASKASATRDLQELVSKGILSQRGVLKGTRYELIGP